MLRFDEYRVRLNNLKPDLDKLGQALDLEAAGRELDELHAQSAADGFWDDVEKAKKVQKRISNLEDKVSAQAKRQGAWEDLMTLCEMGNEEEDESLIPEVEAGFDTLVKEMETARLSTLLSGEYDGATAIVSLQAGAGGTEAQDWAQMLYRMYTRWAERQTLHRFCAGLPGRGRGGDQVRRSASRGTTLRYLKSEHGVHRLVRISPSTPTPAARPPLPPWRSMPELRQRGGGISGTRTSSGRCNAPPGRGASTSTDLLRRAPPPKPTRDRGVLPDRALSFQKRRPV